MSNTRALAPYLDHVTAYVGRPKRPRNAIDRRVSRADLAAYWRTLDRALALSLRNTERALYLASEAEEMARAMGRPDLARNASEVLAIVEEF